jgi:GPH family glycoside/pentoside/hexuronide:cation symporter
VTESLDNSTTFSPASDISQKTAAPSVPLSFGIKTIYGSGALVETVITTVLTAYHLFYLTAVCGMSGKLAGLSTFIGLAADAFVDPFIGSLSDNSHSRWGRRHPFLIASAVPIAVSFGLMFTIPSSFTGTLLFVYATGIYLCMRFGLSAFVIPYMAMGGELTDDFHERSIVVAFRHAFGILAGFLPLLIGLPLFLKGGNVLLRQAYIPYAWTCAGIVLAGAAASGFGSLSVRNRLHSPAADAAPMNFFREVAEVFRNRSFLILFGALVIFFVAQGLAGVLALDTALFFWKLPTSTISVLQLAVPFGSAIGIPIILTLAKRFEKRNIALGGQLGYCLAQMTLPLLRIAGMLPPNGPLLTPILIANFVFVGITVTALVIGFQSMMADAADEHDFIFGSRREGIYFAGLSFSVKLTAAVGVLLGGTARDLIGVPTAIAQHGGMNIHLPAETIRNLGLVSGPVPALITMTGIWVIWHYRIDRKRHAEIKRVLDERRRSS